MGLVTDGMVSLDIDKMSQLKLERAMAKLPDKVYAKVVGAAASFAMRAVVTAARKKAPVRSGTLRKSIGTKRKKYKRSGVVVVVVGVRKGYRDPETGEEPANIVHLVEYGAKAHTISGRPLIINGDVVWGTVHHPGARAQPFILPALREQAPKVLARYRSKLMPGIEKETRKLRRSGR